MQERERPPASECTTYTCGNHKCTCKSVSDSQQVNVRHTRAAITAACAITMRPVRSRCPITSIRMGRSPTCGFHFPKKQHKSKREEGVIRQVIVTIGECACMYVCTCGYKHVCMHVCMCVCVCVCVCVCHYAESSAVPAHTCHCRRYGRTCPGERSAADARYRTKHGRCQGH